MTKAQALAAIRGYALAGRYVISGHAWDRMRERRVRESDLRHALGNAVRCTSQPGDRWKVEGEDLDGDDLTVIVVIEDGLLVVTLF